MRILFSWYGMKLSPNVETVLGEEMSKLPSYKELEKRANDLYDLMDQKSVLMSGGEQVA